MEFVELVGPGDGHREATGHEDDAALEVPGPGNPLAALGDAVGGFHGESVLVVQA
jgi:hypothetical protein